MNDQVNPDPAFDKLADALADFHDRLAFGGSTETPRDLDEAFEPTLLGHLLADQKCLERIERVRRRCGDALAPLLRGLIHSPASVTQVEPKVHQTIGRFEIVEELGHGGYGIVLLARDPVVGRNVALKVPRAEALFVPDLRARFLREAQAAGRLTHPNIVPVYEVGEAGPVCYIASAHCAGSTLREWLAEQSGPVPARLAARIVADLASAVAYAHSQGVLHRDLKPSNVLLDLPPQRPPSDAAAGRGLRGASDFEFVPKLTDFGLAKLSESSDPVTRTGILMGTPAYMAPEQAEGRLGEIGPRTDVYALGAILYELLGGRPPFEGVSDAATLRRVVADDARPLGQIRPALSPDLEAIALKCLEKRPERRYSSALALADDLHRYLVGEPTLARPIGRFGRIIKWAMRHPTAAALVATSIVATALVTVLLIVSVLALERARVNEEALSESNAQLTTALDESHRLQHAAARRLYAVDMKRAFEAWRLADIGLARRLLANHVSRSDLPDVRGFEWYYLQSRLDQSERTFLGHDGSVNAVAVSPDGQWIVSGGEDRAIRLWSAHSAEPPRVFATLEDEVNRLVFSPDGSHLASGSEDGMVHLWNVTTASLQHAWTLGEAVNSVQFSRQGARVAAAGTRGEVRVWNTEDGAQVASFGAKAQVESLAFTPDGDGILLASHIESRVSTICRWNPREDSIEVLVADLPHVIPWISVSGCGRYLASSHEDGSLRVWQLPSGRLLRHLYVHEDKAMFVDFSPDDTQLISCGRDRLIRVTPWRAHRFEVPQPVSRVTASCDGRYVCTLAETGHAAFVMDREMNELRMQPETTGRWEACRFSADGRHLVLGPDPLEVWDMASGSMVGRLDGPNSPIAALAINGATSDVITIGYDGRIERSNVESGKRITVETESREPGVTCAAVLSRRNQIVLARQDGLVHICDARTGDVQYVLGRRGVFEAVWSSHNGRWLAFLARDRRLHLFDLDRRTEVALIDRNLGAVQAVDLLDDGTIYVLVNEGRIETHVPPGNPVAPRRVPTVDRATDLAALGDGLVAAVRYEKNVLVLDTYPLAEPSSWRGHFGAVWSAAVAPDGRHVASGGADGKVMWWDITRHENQDRSLAARVECARILDDDRHIVTGDFSGTALLWDLTAPESPVVLEAMDGPVRAIDGRGPDMIALAGDAREVRVVGARTGLSEAAVADHRSIAHAAALSPDGQLLATGELSGHIHLWEASGSVRRVGTLEGHNGEIAGLAFSSDGHLLASAGHDRQVCLWSVADRTLIHTLEGHTKTPFHLVFSPDGKAVYSAGGDRTVRRWDVSSGRELATFVNDEEAKALALTPNGKTLAVGSDSGKIVLWHVPTSSELGQLAQLRGNIRALRFDRNGLALTAIVKRSDNAGFATTLRCASAAEIRTLPSAAKSATASSPTIDDNAVRFVINKPKSNSGGKKLVVDTRQLLRFPGNLRVADTRATFGNAARIVSFNGEIESTSADCPPAHLVLRDPGTRWLSANGIVMASAAEARLDIESAAECLAGGIVSLNGPNACNVTVRGSDSRLETKSFLNVLTGSLRVLNGGTVRCRVATIGDARDDRKSHAAVVLEGNGSRCEARASIIVGSDGAHGTARLTVRDGAEMHSRKSVHIRPSGIVQLGGGSLRSALIDITHGSLAGFGHVLADVRNGGMVELSPDDGVLAIDGSFEQIASGRLRITTVRPPFGNSIAFLNCDGDVRLNGCLELRCADAPQLGDAIKLLCAKSITGEFSELDLPPLPDSEAWRLQVRNGCMTLTVVAR